VQDPATVLFVHSSSGRYGADRQLRLLASGLDRSRYRPLVVLPSGGPLARDLSSDGIEVLAGPVSVIRRELADPRGVATLLAGTASNARSLGRLIRRRRVSLVHSNTSVVLGAAAAAAASSVPHVWHVRESYERFGRIWPAYRRVLMTAQALPCVSAATAAQFPRSDRIHVIPDGLAVEPVRTSRVAAREALGLDPELPVIAVLGRISDWKGQDVLVRALAEPPLRARGTLGLIAGEAWAGAEHRAAAIRNLAASLGVADRLRMVGFRDDVGALFAAADLVAVPSTAPDPLPGAAIEAAYAGCAVIASEHGGLPEIIRDRQTGRLVAPGDAAALATVAAELLDDPAERERLGKEAALQVRARFSPTRLLDSMQALYDSLLARGAPAAGATA
jgi:glycosyltransferase involved in cell wall biosynthesis